VIWATIGKLALAYQAGITVRQIVERHTYWKQARDYADSVGKPLLCIGMSRLPWHAPNGDTTVDIDPAVEAIPGGVCADERAMPFADEEFGAVFNSHTLEHLATAEDVEFAVNECLRVADKAIFLAPSPYDLLSNLYSAHHLRLWFDQTNNRIKVTDNRWRTGLGFNAGPKIAQALVMDSTSMPEIVKIGSAYIFGGNHENIAQTP
jgi:hypothetical protein